MRRPAKALLLLIACVIKYSQRTVLIVLLLLAVTTHIGVFAQSDASLHKKIQELLTKEQLTGAVWTLVDSGGWIHSDCAGIKNTATHESLKPTDKVHVGSITKTIMAAGILHLVTEGKLGLDDPLNKHLPHTNLINPWEAIHPVTIRHLLDHTSGLSDLKLWHFFSTSSTPITPLSAFYKSNPDLLTVHFQPGTIFSYSNMGYTLVGMVIESVTKQPYEKYLDKHLLRPLGMRNSTFEFVTQVGKQADKALAMGHLDKGEPHPALPVYLRPAGQFTTTAYDMGLFMRFMMGDGTIDGKPLINQQLLASVGKATTTLATNRGVPYGYALGAYYRDRHEVVGIAHSGSIVGYHSFMCMFPKEKKALFISFNIDSETADYEVFNEVLIRHLNIPKQKAFPKAQNADSLLEWQGYYIPGITKVEPFGILDYVGSFTHVTIQEKGAVVMPFQKAAKSLTYLGNQLLMEEKKTSPSHLFYKNEQDELCITNGISTIRKVNGVKILLIAASLALGILGFVYLLISGFYQFMRFGSSDLWKRPVFWVFTAILISLAAVPLIAFQSFVAMGDITPGNVLLAAGTTALLIFSFVSIIRYFTCKQPKLCYKTDLVAILCLFQLTVLLYMNDLLPFALWK